MTFSTQQASDMVEEAISLYGPHLDMAVHHEFVASNFGELVEGAPADSQMADMGVLVAVLFWKLAQARGKLGEARPGGGAVQDPHA